VQEQIRVSVSKGLSTGYVEFVLLD